MDVSDSDFPLLFPKFDLSVFTVVKFSLNMISFKSTQIYFNKYRYLDYFILDWNFSIWTCFVNFAAVLHMLIPKTWSTPYTFNSECIN